MICIDGHTVDETLFTESGWVIDAGCRGWKFSEAIRDNKPRFAYQNWNYNQYCIDLEMLDVPKHVEVFKQAALTNYTGQTECYLWGDGTANFIKGINGTPGSTEDRPVETITVPAITLDDIYAEIGTDIDLLKLDVEGSEYLILEKFEPIPKQITVEFHQHVHPHLHSTYFPAIWERLCKNYHAVLNVEYPQYLFMDCLFIRKDLI